MSMTQDSAAGSPEVAQRVRERTHAERRRRILRHAILFAAVAVIMLYVAMLQRDTQAVRGAQETGARIAAALQTQWKQQGRLPANLPELGPDFEAIHVQYAFNLLYAGQSSGLRPVLAACSRSPVHMFLRAAGREVVLFDGERFTSQWLAETEFAERRASWGWSAAND